MQALRDTLESRQISLYFGAVATALLAAFWLPDTSTLEPFITPALAVMLYATFLQVPLAELKEAFGQARFLAALMLANFVAVPLLVAALLPLLPAEPILRLGVLLVLLTPCIDYVVTFAHLGRGDARQLLAATPLLLMVQLLLLPVYLGFFLGEQAAALVAPGPFIHAFAWLILLPLALAVLTQLIAARSASGQRLAATLGLLPVPATAVVLFVVIAAVVPQLGPVAAEALGVVPIYLAFALVAPMLGWWVGGRMKLPARERRAIAFSSATRNSLVVLPLALAVPGALPLLPAIIVTQTLVELLSELAYICVIGRLSTPPAESPPP